MTIKFRQPNYFDKLLKIAGKRRSFKVPVEYGNYSYSSIQPESFFRALFRPVNRKLPAGWFYPDDFIKKNGEGCLEDFLGDGMKK